MDYDVLGRCDYESLLGINWDNLMYVVGISGGVGSGKTTVSSQFAGLGITIADADIAARTIVEPGKPVLKKIVDKYGQSILLESGKLNRVLLREIIFNDSDARTWLEKLTHGPINLELRGIIDKSTSPYSILVLSAGTGRSSLMDRLLGIDTSPELQIKRVMVRDNCTREQVQAIMDAQPTRQQRLDIADDILLNDESSDNLSSVVRQFHVKYTNLAKSKRND